MTSRRTPLSFIPSLLPDQTLYSWVTMYHHLSGNASEEETLVQLYGSDKAGHQFHIPSHLDAFCASTQLVLGKPERLIASATILPTYLRFRPSTIVKEVLSRVRSKQTAGITQLLHIAQSRLYTFAPRRTCRLCVDEDLGSHGFAYWHRAHQLPGVLVCPHHGKALASTPMQRHDKKRAGFVTPEQDLMQLGLDSSPSPYSAQDLHILFRLARLSMHMAAETSLDGYSRIAMRSACVAVLRQRNLFCDDPTDCLLQATGHYLDHFRQIAWIPELACARSQRSTRPLWSLLTKTQHADHPLELLLLIDWLFGNWETFCDYYRRHNPD